MSNLAPLANREDFDFDSPTLLERRALGGGAEGGSDLIGMATGMSQIDSGSMVGARTNSSFANDDAMHQPHGIHHHHHHSHVHHHNSQQRRRSSVSQSSGLLHPNNNNNIISSSSNSPSPGKTSGGHGHGVLSQLASPSAHNAIHGATAGPNQHPAGLATAHEVAVLKSEKGRKPRTKRSTSTTSTAGAAAAAAASSASASPDVESPGYALSMPFEAFARHLPTFNLNAPAGEQLYSAGDTSHLYSEQFGPAAGQSVQQQQQQSGFSAALTESSAAAVESLPRDQRRWEPGKLLSEKIHMIAVQGVIPESARGQSNNAGAASAVAAAPSPGGRRKSAIASDALTPPASAGDESEMKSIGVEQEGRQSPTPDGKKTKKKRKNMKGDNNNNNNINSQETDGEVLKTDTSATDLEHSINNNNNVLSLSASVRAKNGKKRALILRGQLYEMHTEHDSLFYFTAEDPTRRRLFLLIDSMEFEYALLALIYIYFCSMFLAVPEVATEKTLTAFFVIEWVTQILYTAEAMVKMVALGVMMHPGSYFSHRMNLFDFCLLVLGWVAIALQEPYHRMLGSLRSLRCFRVLISLRQVAELRAISTTFSTSATKLRDVLILMLFAIVSLAVLGLQIFVGDIERRCVRPVPKSVCMDIKLWAGETNAAKAAAECGIDNRTFWMWMLNRTSSSNSSSSNSSTTTTALSVVAGAATTSQSGNSSSATASTSLSAAVDLCVAPPNPRASAHDCELCNYPSALQQPIIFSTARGNYSSFGQLPSPFSITSSSFAQDATSTNFSFTDMVDPRDVGNGCSSDGLNGHICAPGSICTTNHTLHQDRYHNFNNIGNAFLFVFKLITLDNWPSDTKKFQQSNGFGFFVYSFVLVILATYFCVNLILAILSSGYEHATHQAMELRKISEAEAALVENSRYVEDSDDESVGEDDEDAVVAAVETVDEAATMEKKSVKKEPAGVASIGTNLADDDSRSAGDLSSANNPLSGRRSGDSSSQARNEGNNNHHNNNKAKSSSTDGDGNQFGKKEESMMKQLRLYVRGFTEHELFGHVVLVVTVINVFGLMLDHHGIPPTMEAVLETINLICTIIFLVELGLKLFGLGLLEYVHDTMNLFDGVLCIISIFELIFLSGGGGSKVSALRAFRLTRAFRAIKSSKRLRIMLVTVLRAAYASIVIFGLLFLYLVTGALIVVSFIPNAIDRGVRPNLSTFLDALLTLFIVLTGENWYDTAKLAAEGSSIATLFFFVLFFIVGNYLFLNFVIVILIANFEQSAAGHGDLLDDDEDDDDEQEEEHDDHDDDRDDDRDDDDESDDEDEDENNRIKDNTGEKKNENAAPATANASEQMRSRVMGAVARSGAGGGAQDGAEKKPRRVQFQDMKVDNLTIGGANGNNNSNRNNNNNNEAFSDGETDAEEKIVEGGGSGGGISALKSKVKRAAMLAGALSPTLAAKKKRGKSLNVSELSFRKEHEEEKSGAERCVEGCIAVLRDTAGADDGVDIDPEPTYFGLLARGNCFRELCITLVQHWAFEWLVTIVTLETCVALGFESPKLDLAANPSIAMFLEANNYLAPVFFGIETFIRTVARGWVSYPTSYLRDAWSCLDFFVFITSIVSIPLPQLKILRSLRIFRFASKIDSVKVVIETMVNVLPTMGNVVLLLLFVFIIFAVLGVQFFKGKFVRCNDPSVTRECQCVGNFTAYRPLLEQPFINDTSMTVFSVLNETLPRRWSHAFLNFNNVGSALFSLVVLMFSEQWSELLFNAMDATISEDIVAMSTNANPVAGLYCVLFMIVGNFFLYNLFVGSLMAAFGEEREKRSFSILDQNGGGHQLLTEAQQQWVRTYQIAQASNLSPRVLPPNNAIRAFFCRIYFVDEACAQPRAEFDWFITGSIIVNVLFMASSHSTQPEEWTHGMWIVNLIFAVIFAIEAIVKIFAMMPSLYFADSWNQFDFVLVLLAFVSSFLGGEGGVQIPGASAIRVLRVLRVLRLVKRAKGLQRLFQSLVHALPQLLNVTVLLLLLLFVFGVIGTEVFGHLYTTDSDPDWIITSYFNFHNAGNAMVLLFQIATTEGWPRVVQAAASDEVNSACSQALGTCGNPIAAYFFFIIFMIVVNCIALNLFVFVIIDQYMSMNSDSAAATQVLLERLNHFRELWEFVDTEATQKMRWEQFVTIMHRVFAILTTATDTTDHADIARLMADEEETSKRLGAKSDLKLFRKFRMMDVPVDGVGRVSYRESILGISREHFGLNDEETAMAAQLLSLPEPLDPVKFRHVVKIHHLLAVRSMQRRYRAMKERRRQVEQADTDPVYRLVKVPGMKGTRSISPSGILKPISPTIFGMRRGFATAAAAATSNNATATSASSSEMFKAEDQVSPAAFLPAEERKRAQQQQQQQSALPGKHHVVATSEIVTADGGSSMVSWKQKPSTVRHPNAAVVDEAPAGKESASPLRAASPASAFPRETNNRNNSPVWSRGITFASTAVVAATSVSASPRSSPSPIASSSSSRQAPRGPMKDDMRPISFGKH